MDNESISGDPQNSTPSNGGVSRRSLMKAGAHAAWAIPMVQVVAAAPAFAVSNTLSLSSPSGQWATGSSSTQFTLQITVTNAGGQSAQSVHLTYTFPDNLTWTPTYVGVTAGWSGSGSGKVITLTRPSLASSDTVTVTLSSPSNYKGDAIADIKVAATATGTNSPGTLVSVPSRK